MTLTPPFERAVATGGEPDVRSGTVLSAAPSAEQAFEAFSYAISHDLRAPLRAIEGYAQALVEDYGGDLPEGAREFIARIRRATQVVEQRVDALLRLSRLSRGALRTGPCDLAEAAGHLIDDLHRAEPGRHVETRFAPSIPVIGDATLLGIALENLLTNAWKFTRSRADALIELAVAAVGDDLVVSVSDNGIGFDMRQAHRLGVPFQRLHAGEPFEGLGIGLASARRIIERHGGRLWAEGTPGQGATFHVSLPTVRTP